MKKLGLLSAVAGAMVLAATPLSLRLSSTAAPSLSIDKADARVGRPLTPVSVAGVNRRQNRRAYGAGAVGVGLGAAAIGTAAAVAAAPYYGSGYYGPYYGSSVTVSPASRYYRRDTDRDGVPDRYDRDRDGDGVRNRNDRYPGDWTRR